MANGEFNLTGKIVDGSNKKGLGGLKVEVWDKDVKHNDKLGVVLTDTKGNFKLNFGFEDYVDNPQDSLPDVYVNVFYDNTLLHTTEDAPVKNWKPSDEPLLIEINQPTGTEQQVNGVVTHSDGTPLDGVSIQAFHRLLRGDVSLGTTTTNKLGEYSLQYLPPYGIQYVDLFVRAYDNKDKEIAVSAIRIGAAETEQLDLIVEEERFRGPSEYDQITEVLTQHIFDGNLDQLDANDIALLIRRTGLSRQVITDWITSLRLSQRSGIEHEEMYGLIRQESTASLPRLLGYSGQRLNSAFTGSAQSNIGGFNLGTQANQNVRKLKAVAVEMSLTHETPGSLGRLFSTGKNKSEDLQREFLRRYVAHDGPMRELWQELREDTQFGEAVVEDFQLSLQLGTLTANHAPLVQALRDRGIGRALDTAQLTEADWRDLLQAEIDGTAVGIPDKIKGENLAEQVDNYVNLLTRHTALAYPTAHITRGLKQQPAWQNSATVAFLDANPDFNVVNANIKSTLSSNDVMIDPAWDRSEIQTELEKIQRLSRVSPHGMEEKVVNGLLEQGYSSAFSIARKSRQSFIRATRNVMGDENTARQVFDQAQRQAGLTMGTYSQIQPNLSSPIISAIGGVGDDVSNDPTWSSLFGNVDYCNCEHCRSVYSPAAYLVDLLAWLDSHELNNQSAFNVLDDKRPDIKRIKLSCENTNTVMPYVDLVNEALEVEVLKLEDNNTTVTVPQESTASSDELMAMPEYLYPQVYDEYLSKAVYPSVLPFDLWGELGRVHFEHLGVRRSDLMEVLKRGKVPTRHMISAERLGMTELQWRIILGTTRFAQWRYWGFSSSNSGGNDYKEELANVSNFLSRAELEFDELLDLLHSRFANPNGITLIGEDCNTDEMYLQSMDQDEELELMQRFMRLWRNRGWSMLDVDKYLHVIATPELDATALNRLADIDHLMELTGASLLDILSWWSVIDTFEDRQEKNHPVKSLYNQVFLNRAVDTNAETDDYPLALNTARDGLKHSINWQNEQLRALLQAALGIDAEVLVLLVDEEIDEEVNPNRVVTGEEVTLEDLSALYRHISLARILKINVEALLGLLRLTGIEPFDLAATEQTVKLVETFNAIEDSDFSLDELHYLLEHDAEAETRVGVTDESIGQTLVEIRDGLARIESDFVVVSDPTGDTTARYLGLILDADAVTEVMATLHTKADGVNDSGLASSLTDHLSELLDIDADAIIALDPEARFDELLTVLVPYIKETQGDALIIEKIASFAERELDSVEDLLSVRLTMEQDGQIVTMLDGLRNSPFVFNEASEFVLDDDVEAFNALRQVFKVSMVLSRLDLDIDEQQWLFDVGVEHGLYNPILLPSIAAPFVPGSAWVDWIALVDLFALRDEMPGGEPTLIEMLHLLDNEDEETFLDELVTRTGWSVDDLDKLVALFNLNYPQAWYDGRALRRIHEAMKLIQRAGVTAEQADTWVTAPIDMQQADALRLAAKAKHDVSRWPEIARGLRDPVREKQRAALVAYLVANNSGYSDATALFDELLIDVEMDACMLTSRIKQAISSVQLFVQRAFLNQEEGVELTSEDRVAWGWMKTYRIWEANRKVFLYPENWIEPDLRLNKSELFEQLESNLLEAELSEETVEKAYTNYLEGLQEIVRLEVMAMYHQNTDDDDGTENLLHVVARTHTKPHRYFYRQWIDAREWTPWEKIDADIEADHIILAVHDRRLYLFWPMVVQKSKTEETGDEETSVTFFFEMKLVSIERLNEKWGNRNLSDEFLTIQGKWRPDSSDSKVIRSGTASGINSMTEMRTYFRINNDLSDLKNLNTNTLFSQFKTMTNVEQSLDNRLKIEVRQGLNSGGIDKLGTFILDSSTGKLIVDTEQEADALITMPGLQRIERMRYSLNDGRALQPSPEEGKAFSLSIINDEVEILGVVKGQRYGSYIYPAQYDEFTSQHGVFLDDDDRTFHVMPEPAIDWEKLSQPEQQDDIEPKDVGIGQTYDDIFDNEVDYPEFEPELEWDKGDLVLDQIDPNPNFRMARAATETVTVDYTTSTSATIEQLSTEQLQQSQNSLFEAFSDTDSNAASQTTKYRFSLFYHPYVKDFMKQLRRLGVAGLLDPNPNGEGGELVRQLKTHDFFESAYEPTSHTLSYPVENIDFEVGGAYAEYNWELFFHAPLLVATRLSQEQRFEEAHKWFHYIFDPTNRSEDDDPLRFWKIKPLYKEAADSINEFLELAASSSTSEEAVEARRQYEDQLDAWLANPFEPHTIARLRYTAYQKTVVMKYLDNLIAWGDHLFRRDTIETLNEATQLYVLALQLLGERPDAIPPTSKPIEKTFEEVRDDLDDMVLNNPLVELENIVIRIPDINGRRMTTGSLQVDTQLATVSLGHPQLYFGIPHNEKLLGYWDTIEDRLFKIRNCMNIEGIVRQLPLFEPPIDPGMLVRARAAGVDLSSALADLNAPLPHYRFGVMLQKAFALNQTVRSLGSALLSALEKKDAEALASLRANQEVALLDAVREVKKLSVDEAREGLKAAQRSLDVVKQRCSYYEGLIKKGKISEEIKQLKRIKESSTLNTISSGMHAFAGMLTPTVPSIELGVVGLQPTFSYKVSSGQALGSAMNALGSAAMATASHFSSKATVKGIEAGYKRRKQEWQNQLDTAKKEIKQIETQIEAANVRVALAEADQTNHDRQLDHARTVRTYMEQKFTNTELYQWMVGQLSSLYFQSYQLVYDLAKQAERAYRHELALFDATFINFGYWDSMKKGLLSGERLQLDLERMDKSYLDNNRREYELNKHISLANLDPVALLQLQIEGECQFSIPEVLFDLETAGHYLRRIKSVSVSIPCVTGPYTSVPAQLTLISSRTRIDPVTGGSYAYDDSTGGDSRFQIQIGAIQTINISTGREDFGLFNPDHRDERYLPFEGCGVISDWSLKLTSAVPTFDWSTMSDVILHIRYTAREGGETLRSEAFADIDTALSGTTLCKAFSARHEFPSQWNTFLNPSEIDTTSTLSIELTDKHFPYFTQSGSLGITNMEVVGIIKDPQEWGSASITSIDVSTAGEEPESVPFTESDLYADNPSADISYDLSVEPGGWDFTVDTTNLDELSSVFDDFIIIAMYKVEIE